MKAPIRYFAFMAMVVVVAFGLLAHGQWRRDIDRNRGEQALIVAKSVSWLVGQGDREALKGVVQAIPEHVSGVKRLLVLKGAKYLAHTQVGLVGKSLSSDSMADKDLYDQAARLKASVRKNVEEHERNPDLKGNAYPEAESEIFDDQGILGVAVPNMEGGRFTGMTEVRLSPGEAPFGMPWSFMFVGLLTIGIFAAISLRLRGWPLLGAGAALMVAMVILQAVGLVNWREKARESAVAQQAELLGKLIQSGLLRTGETGEHPDTDSLVQLLRTDAMGEQSGGLESIGDSVTGAPADAGSHRFVTGDHAIAYSPTYFQEKRSEDQRHMVQWASGFLILALAGLFFGLLGHLGRAGRAVAKHRWAYAYLSPAMLGIMVLVFIPVAYGFVLGFEERRYGMFYFAGMDNYLSILGDFNWEKTGNFYRTLWVTILWTVSNVGLHVIIGLFLALLLNDQMLKARGIYRVILIIPWAIPNYITALIWKGMFHKQFGAVNHFLDLFGVEPVSWFQSFWTSFSTNLTTNVWLGFPFMMVVSLGALQSIPADLYEAARVDGARRFQRFRHITLPLLKPALVPAVIVGTVWTFNMFNIIYLVSGGGPNGETDILITDAYRWAFERDRWGYAAAYSALIFFILLSFTLVTNRITGATKGAYE